MIVRTFFNENIPNQFYIPLYVQIFNIFVFLLKRILNYIFINSFKNYLPRKLMYMRTKSPMMDVLNSQTAKYGRSKHLNFKYTTVVLL